MRILAVTLCALLLASCSPQETHTRSLYTEELVLDWQKPSESIQRGYYSHQEDIKKSEFRQIVEPMCIRTSVPDSRIKLSDEVVRYIEFSPSKDATEPTRIIERTKVLESKSNGFLVDAKTWTSSDNKNFSFFSRQGSRTKIDYFKDGRFFTVENWTAGIGGDLSSFPAVDSGDILKEVAATLASRPETGTEYSIGKFELGSGESTKAAMRLWWGGYGAGKKAIDVLIYIPLASSISDLSCSPETVYSGFAIVLDDGTISFKWETEILRTTAQ